MSITSFLKWWTWNMSYKEIVDLSHDYMMSHYNTPEKILILYWDYLSEDQKRILNNFFYEYLKINSNPNKSWTLNYLDLWIELWIESILKSCDEFDKYYLDTYLKRYKNLKKHNIFVKWTTFFDKLKNNKISKDELFEKIVLNIWAIDILKLEKEFDLQELAKKSKVFKCYIDLILWYVRITDCKMSSIDILNKYLLIKKDFCLTYEKS